MECKGCDHNMGFDDVGYPNCEYEGECPFDVDLKKGVASLHVDMDHLNRKINEYTQARIDGVVSRAVEEIVRGQCKGQIEGLVSQAIKDRLDICVSEYLDGEITIGGGWNSEKRTLTRTELLNESIQKLLSETFDNKKTVANEVIKHANPLITKSVNMLREEISKKLSATFDELTRQNLANNVVEMLMSTDTYRRLSDNMKNLLPDR